MIPPTRLVRGGDARRASCCDDLTGRMRGPRQREADLRAQLAANRVAAQRLGELAERHGLGRCSSGHGGGARLRRAAHARRDRRDPRRPLRGARRARGRRRGEPRHARDRCHASRRGATRSRSTSPAPTPQSDGNLNCPLSVTKSAVYYVLRVADRPRHPGLGGRLPARARDRSGRLPRQRAPAGGGRGRQRRDLEPDRRRGHARVRRGDRVPAQGQGTMNNLTLGNDAFTYYETLGGGQGACPDADGPSGRARRDEQHAQHAGRGARAGVPAAGDASTRLRRGLGRRRAPPGRRRPRARDRGAGARWSSPC